MLGTSARASRIENTCPIENRKEPVSEINPWYRRRSYVRRMLSDITKLITPLRRLLLVSCFPVTSVSSPRALLGRYESASLLCTSMWPWNPRIQFHSQSLSSVALDLFLLVCWLEWALRVRPGCPLLIVDHMLTPEYFDFYKTRPTPVRCACPISMMSWLHQQSGLIPCGISLVSSKQRWSYPVSF